MQRAEVSRFAQHSLSFARNLIISGKRRGVSRSTPYLVIRRSLQDIREKRVHARRHRVYLRRTIQLNAKNASGLFGSDFSIVHLLCTPYEFLRPSEFGAPALAVLILRATPRRLGASLQTFRLGVFRDVAGDHQRTESTPALGVHSPLGMRSRFWARVSR